MTIVKHIILKKRPALQLTADDFELTTTTLRELKGGELLIRNSFLSLDAGFRQRINECASDNYLQAMPLGQPVQSIVLGVVESSISPAYPAGACVMRRTSWETHSIADGSDPMTIIEPEKDSLLRYAARPKSR